MTGSSLPRPDDAFMPSPMPDSRGVSFPPSGAPSSTTPPSSRKSMAVLNFLAPGPTSTSRSCPLAAMRSHSSLCVLSMSKVYSLCVFTLSFCVQIAPIRHSGHSVVVSDEKGCLVLGSCYSHLRTFLRPTLSLTRIEHLDGFDSRLQPLSLCGM